MRTSDLPGWLGHDDDCPCRVCISNRPGGARYRARMLAAIALVVVVAAASCDANRSHHVSRPTGQPPTGYLPAAGGSLPRFPAAPGG